MKALVSVIIGSAAVLLVGCDVPAPTQQVTRSGPVERDLAWEAYAVGRRAAEMALKAPATARFSSPGHAPHGFQQWKVWGQVDSQNSFGALLRSPWVAVVKLGAEQWSVEYLRIGEQESGEMPGVALAPPTLEEVAARKAAADDKLAKMKAAAADKLAKMRTAELKHHQDLAAKLDAYGLYRMGRRYLEGDGVDQNEAKGRELLHLATLAGSDEAKLLLAKLK